MVFLSVAWALKYFSLVNLSLMLKTKVKKAHLIQQQKFLEEKKCTLFFSVPLRANESLALRKKKIDQTVPFACLPDDANKALSFLTGA
jgi:hypothetical protein